MGSEEKTDHVLPGTAALYFVKSKTHHRKQTHPLYTFLVMQVFLYHTIISRVVDALPEGQPLLLLHYSQIQTADRMVYQK